MMKGLRGMLSRAFDRGLLAPEDPRPLALCRIALVSVFLLAYATHLGSVDAYFSEHSVIAGEVAREAFPERWSLLFAVSHVGAVRGLFAVGLVAHVTWLLGWWTRTSAAVAWVMWVSLMGRQPLLYSLGDQLLMALCTLLALMPSGRALSIDARRGRRPVPVWCRRILQLQLATMYVATGSLKSGTTWWPDGTALYYAIVNPYNRHFVELGPWLARLQPWLLRPLTIAVWLWELLFGLFVVLHWLRSAGVRRVPDLRPVFLGIGVMVHAGIAALLYVAWFSPLCVATYAAFIEPREPGRGGKRGDQETRDDNNPG